MFRKSIVVIVLMLLVFSCNNKDDIPQDRVLIFGWFADSSCTGDCADMYKISDEKIFKDIDFNYPVGNYFKGNFQEMRKIDFNEMMVLLDQLPDELLNEPDGYLDCLDCTDEFGGFYLEYKTDKIHKTWRIRNAQYPSYFESYRSLLLRKLEYLNSD